MKTCGDCKHFGKNLDEDIDEYCWSGLFPVDKDESACIVFENKEGGE